MAQGLFILSTPPPVPQGKQNETKRNRIETKELQSPTVLEEMPHVPRKLNEEMVAGPGWIKL